MKPVNPERDRMPDPNQPQVPIVIIVVAGMVNPDADSGFPVGNPIGY